MAVSGLTAASSFQPATPQVSPSSGHHHRHNGHRATAISDVDAQSSSIATAGNYSRTVGSTLDVTA